MIVCEAWRRSPSWAHTESTSFLQQCRCSCRWARPSGFRPSLRAQSAPRQCRRCGRTWSRRPRHVGPPSGSRYCCSGQPLESPTTWLTGFLEWFNEVGLPEVDDLLKPASLSLLCCNSLASRSPDGFLPCSEQLEFLRLSTRPRLSDVLRPNIGTSEVRLGLEVTLGDLDSLEIRRLLGISDLLSKM